MIISPSRETGGSDRTRLTRLLWRIFLSPCGLPGSPPASTSSAGLTGLPMCRLKPGRQSPDPILRSPVRGQGQRGKPTASERHRSAAPAAAGSSRPRPASRGPSPARRRTSRPARPSRPRGDDAARTSAPAFTRISPASSRPSASSSTTRIREISRSEIGLTRSGPGPTAALALRRRGSAGTAATGSVTVNVAPEPRPALSALTVPPCSSTRCRTIASPRPSPPCRARRRCCRPGGSARRRAAGTRARCPRPCR